MKHTANAVTEEKPRLASRVPCRSVGMTEINQYLMCQLCSGYLVDATAIIECQHTFCKSCILKYLETNSYCPICDVQLNKAKPHLSLRPDTILQKLVYKLVPGLFVTEVRRRKDFLDSSSSTDSSSVAQALELEETEDLCVLSLDDAVSLSLEYFKSNDEDDEDTKQSLQSHKKNTCDKANDRRYLRYLQCPAAVSVGLLKKFIRMKYGLSDNRVDLLYNGDRDNNLENDLTLLDLAFIFKWKKAEPMCFHYRIFDRPAKSALVRPGTKRPAPSMMDEPPDDDAASGPPNSSMTSASPSKLPRISEASSNSNSSNSQQGNGSNTTSSGSNKKTGAVTSDKPAVNANNESNNLTDTKDGKGSSRNSIKAKHGNKSPSRSRSHSINTEKELEKDNSEPMVTSPPQTRRSSLTLTLSKRFDGKRLSSSSTGSHKASEGEESKITLAKNITKMGSKSSNLVSAAAAVTASSQVASSGKNQVNSSLSRTISSSSSSSSVSSGSSKEQHHSLKISFGKTKHHHRHHHKSKDKRKDRERRHSSRSSSTANKITDSNHQKHGTQIKGGKASKMTTRGDDKDHKNIQTVTTSTSANANPTNLNAKESKSIKGDASMTTTTSGPATASVAVSAGGRSTLNSGGIGIIPRPNNNNNNVNNNHQPPTTSTNNSHNQKGSNTVSGNCLGGQMANIGRGGTSGSQTSSHMNVNLSTSTNLNVNPPKVVSVGNHTKISSSCGSIMKSLDMQCSRPPVSSSSSLTTSSMTSQNQNQQQNTGNSHHSLLPESVQLQVPKSVTLIPVNPNAPSGQKMSRGPDKNTGMNRLNSHTFTHPITNKSLHQITVTEVPPPVIKSTTSSSSSTSSTSSTNSSSTGVNSLNPTNCSNSSGGNVNNANGTNTNNASGHEKSAHSKHFNGPGSMEITKIYCDSNTSVGKSFEVGGKKLKERKGLDITISPTPSSALAPGASNKSSRTIIDEALTFGQKVNTTKGNRSTSSPVSAQTGNVMPQQQQQQGNPNIKNSLNISQQHQMPIMRNIHTSNSKSESLTKTLPNRRSSLSIEPAKPNAGNMSSLLTPNEPHTTNSQNQHHTSSGNKTGQQQQLTPCNSSSHRKTIGNLDSSIAIYEVNSLHRTPSPPKDKGLVVTPVPSSRDTLPSPSMMPNTNMSTSTKGSHGHKRSSYNDNIVSSHGQTQPPPQSQALSLSRKSGGNSSSNRDSPGPDRTVKSKGNSNSSSVSVATEHERPLDLSGKSSRSPTESKSDNSFSSSSSNNVNKPPTPASSPSTLSNSPSERKSKSQQQSAAHTQTILSIAQSLAHKHQQQQLKGSSGGHKSKTSSHLNSHINIPGSGPVGSLAHSLSPPIIPMPTPSPPGAFNPLRNLVTLSDAASCLRKLHHETLGTSLNQLVAAAAAGFCPPPSSSTLIPPSQGIFSTGLTLPPHSKSSSSHLSSALSGSNLSSLSSLKPSTSSSFLSPSINSANQMSSLTSWPGNVNLSIGRGIVSNSQVLGGAGSLSPPLSPLQNSFYSSLAAAGHTPMTTSSSRSSSSALRIPTVTPKLNSGSSSSSNNNKGLNSIITPTTYHQQLSSLGLQSPLYSSTLASTPSGNPTTISNNHNNKSLISSAISNQNSSTNSAAHILRSSSLSSSRSSKINGNISSISKALMEQPHGITTCVTSKTTTTNATCSSPPPPSFNTFVAPSSIKPISKLQSQLAKNAIPNSMKISNFLPPPQSKSSSSSTHATITSSSDNLAKYLSNLNPLLPQSQSPPSSNSSTSSSSSSARSSSNLSHLSNQDITITPSTQIPAINSMGLSSPPTFSFSLSSNVSSLSNNLMSGLSPTKSSTSTSSVVDNSSKSLTSNSTTNKSGLNVTPVSESTSGGKIGPTTTTTTTSIGQGLCLNYGNGPSFTTTKTVTTTVGTSRTTQPQNQAVRHIPNPSLLFNRQQQSNNSLCQTHNTPTTTTTNNPLTVPKTLTLPTTTAITTDTVMATASVSASQPTITMESTTVSSSLAHTKKENDDNVVNVHVDDKTGIKIIPISPLPSPTKETPKEVSSVVGENEGNVEIKLEPKVKISLLSNDDNSKSSKIEKESQEESEPENKVQVASPHKDEQKKEEEELIIPSPSKPQVESESEQDKKNSSTCSESTPPTPIPTVVSTKEQEEQESTSSNSSPLPSIEPTSCTSQLESSLVEAPMGMEPNPELTVEKEPELESTQEKDGEKKEEEIIPIQMGENNGDIEKITEVDQQSQIDCNIIPLSCPTPPPSETATTSDITDKSKEKKMEECLETGENEAKSQVDLDILPTLNANAISTTEAEESSAMDLGEDVSKGNIETKEEIDLELKPSNSDSPIVQQETETQASETPLVIDSTPVIPEKEIPSLPQSPSPPPQLPIEIEEENPKQSDTLIPATTDIINSSINKDDIDQVAQVEVEVEEPQEKGEEEQVEDKPVTEEVKPVEINETEKSTMNIIKELTLTPPPPTSCDQLVDDFDMDDNSDELFIDAKSEEDAEMTNISDDNSFENIDNTTGDNAVTLSFCNAETPDSPQNDEKGHPVESGEQSKFNFSSISLHTTLPLLSIPLSPPTEVEEQEIKLPLMLSDTLLSPQEQKQDETETDSQDHIVTHESESEAECVSNIESNESINITQDIEDESMKSEPMDIDEEPMSLLQMDPHISSIDSEPITSTTSVVTSVDYVTPETNEMNDKLVELPISQNETNLDMDTSENEHEQPLHQIIHRESETMPDNIMADDPEEVEEEPCNNFLISSSSPSPPSPVPVTDSEVGVVQEESEKIPEPLQSTCELPCSPQTKQFESIEIKNERPVSDHEEESMEIDSFLHVDTPTSPKFNEPEPDASPAEHLAEDESTTINTEPLNCNEILETNIQIPTTLVIPLESLIPIQLQEQETKEHENREILSQPIIPSLETTDSTETEIMTRQEVGQELRIEIEQDQSLCQSVHLHDDLSVNVDLDGVQTPERSESSPSPHEKLSSSTPSPTSNRAGSPSIKVKMENLEKVAAGLLASASINNNNNSFTSGVGVNCEIGSMATASPTATTTA